MNNSSQLRTYDPASCVVFRKTNERFGGLSNMAAGFPLQVNGISIRTSEALYQACRFPHMPEVQRLIIGENSPMTAKMRGKPYRDQSRGDWDSVRTKIMRWCIRVKLAQNWRTFGDLLIETGDKPIVEYSSKDDFWGAQPQEDGSLQGMNVLGRLLMELREQIRSGAPKDLRAVAPLTLENFLLYGKPIEALGPVGERESAVPVCPAPAQGTLFDAEPPQARKGLKLGTFSGMNAKATPINGELAPYEQMRATGLDWLGKIPAHWELLRSGSIFREVSQAGHPDLELLSIRSGIGVVTQRSTGRKVRASEDRSKYKRIQPGWLGYNLMNAFFGGIGISEHEGILSPAYAVAEPKFDIYSRFFQYLYQSPSYLAEFNRQSYGIMYERNRLYFDRFRLIPVPLPPLEEQRAIVRFLDWHGAQVSRLLRAKKRLIALLNEQKQTIIHRAFTRGLDENVPLKPSGIEWLGDIPAHWEMRRLKSLVRMQSGNAITAERIEEMGDYPVYGGNGLRGFTTEHTHHGDFVLIGRQGALCGNINYASGQFYASEHAVVAHPRITFDTFWLGELLRLMNLGQYSIAAAQPGLSVERIAPLALPFPPPNEQSEISSFLQDLINHATTAVTQIQSKIALIQEYRARLIADVVTGKLDVRAMAEALPDTPPEELAALDDGASEDELLDDAEEDEETAA